jgi:outer membrane protein assembly factor BamB
MAARPPGAGLRWWPAAVVVGIIAAAIAWIRLEPELSFQQRNLATLSVSLGGAFVLLIWWLGFSRAAWKLRLQILSAFIGFICVFALCVQYRGVSGDLVPILDFRWQGKTAVVSSEPQRVPGIRPKVEHPDYPQFLGPERNAQLEQAALDPDWSVRPPQILWRQPVGTAWAGWAIVANRAFTQEQRGGSESVTCYHALTGALIWSHSDEVHYQNALAGDGPRCTPTVHRGRVFSLGATGLLNCLDAEKGQRVWSRKIVGDGRTQIPEWGFAGSPLRYDEKVVVSAGGREGRSLLAYQESTGELLWAAGTRGASYATPFLTTLAGVRQVLAFNSRFITAHDAATGAVLWEYPWGTGHPQVAVPVIVGTNRVLFSSGYGVGSELLEISRDLAGNLKARQVWRSRQMKAKFANLVQRDGCLYGLDDGVLAALDLKDGARLWKEGRYGHGQGLLINDLFLLMAENGELVLLRPSQTGPNELQRFRVFHNKTWNPIALAGDLLLVRNDTEAACLRLALHDPQSPAGP